MQHACAAHVQNENKHLTPKFTLHRSWPTILADIYMLLSYFNYLKHQLKSFTLLAREAGMAQKQIQSYSVFTGAQALPAAVESSSKPLDQEGLHLKVRVNCIYAVDELEVCRARTA